MNDLQQEVRGKTFGYVNAALGLVAGLAWNEAIKALIEAVFPVARNTVLVKFVYAALVTIVVVVLIKYIDRAVNGPQKPDSNA